MINFENLRDLCGSVAKFKSTILMENGKLLRTILAPHWWDLSPWEAKTFITIFWFADPATGELAISLYSLSQKVNSLTRDLLPWLEKLKLRGLIDIAPGPNPLLESRFKILSGKSPVSEMEAGQKNEEIEYLPLDPEETPLPVNGNDPGSGNGRSLKGAVPAGNATVPVGPKRGDRDEITKSGTLTAESIARSLNDLENIALYEAYLKRYPEEVIRKAYRDVQQTPPEKIKKSAGAYFTFLVKKYGG